VAAFCVDFTCAKKIEDRRGIKIRLCLGVSDQDLGLIDPLLEMQLKVAEFEICLADHLRIQRLLGLKFIQKCVDFDCEANCCFFFEMSILETLPDH
jgi:hypothetical protein